MGKELVVYFSVYGTAKIVAEEIAKQTGADIVEIEPVIPYDSNREHYNALARIAKKEHDEDQRPAIKNKIDIDSYDTIYIGYPMWWYTFPMIIYTFFDKYDFSGKTIIPFNTHMGSGDGGTYDKPLPLCCRQGLRSLPMWQSGSGGSAAPYDSLLRVQISVSQ